MNPVKHVANKLVTDGPKATAAGLFRAALFRYYKYSPFYDPAPIYDENWDVCILLDGCRPDALDVFKNDYDFLPTSIKSAWSVAGDSFHWMDKTFGEKYSQDIQDTIYVTGNPHADRLSAARFSDIDHVWKYAWDDEVGTTPADATVDRAITHGRKSRQSRLLVHLMQPQYLTKHCQLV